MPLQQCGTRGWQYGKNGHCYDGPSESLNKKKAINQGLAITGGGEKFKKEMAESKLSGETLQYVKALLNKKTETSFIDCLHNSFEKIKDNKPCK